MAVTFQELLEGTELSEEARSTIQEAWESSLAEARDAQSAELREEFAQRYEHDKGKIVEGVEGFINSRVEAEIAELVEDRKALSAEKVAYRKAVAEHANVLDSFVMQTLAKEVQELRADRSRLGEHMDKLDEFVTESLAEELAEFHEDKKALVEQKVKMIRAGKKALTETKKQFISKAADKVEKVVNKVVTNEVNSLREDITAARENDFGRKIFEAFVTEFGTSYLNEAKEIRKVQKELAQVKANLEEAKSEIVSKEKATKIVESKLRIEADKNARANKLNSLLKNLGGDKKVLMLDLLEQVQTQDLDKAFNKYLPSVLNEDKPRAKKAITESVVSEHTGNKRGPAPAAAHNTEEDADIINLRKLAGLSN